MEKVTFEPGLDKLVEFSQALRVEGGLWGETVMGLIPLFNPILVVC